MGMIDDLKAKGNDLMSDPEKKAQIEQMAKDKGISIEDAKAHFASKENKA